MSEEYVCSSCGKIKHDSLDVYLTVKGVFCNRCYERMLTKTHNYFYKSKNKDIERKILNINIEDTVAINISKYININKTVKKEDYELMQ